jgi:hypothetical protein
MKKILLFIFLLTGIISSNAQSMFFPEAWTGRWKGNLSIFTKEGTVSTVEMNIVLEKTSTPNNYSFIIIYKQGEKEDVRNYTLIKDTSNAGHFITDEQNSIRINDYLFGSTLISQFIVEGQLLTAVYRFEKNKIDFTIISTNAMPTGSSGGKDKIPVVKDFEIMNYQNAILERVKQ